MSYVFSISYDQNLKSFIEEKNNENGEDIYWNYKKEINLNEKQQISIKLSQSQAHSLINHKIDLQIFMSPSILLPCHAVDAAGSSSKHSVYTYVQLWDMIHAI